MGSPHRIAMQRRGRRARWALVCAVVAVASSDSANAARLPRPTFAAPLTVLLGPPYVDIGATFVALTAPDLDGDSDLDLVTVSLTQDHVVILQNDGMGGFGEPTFLLEGSDPNEVAAADLDGDGDVDLAMAGAKSPVLRVLRNDGTGRFPRVATFDVGDISGGIVARDLDGDGDADIAVINPDRVAILLNNGRGRFGPPFSAVSLNGLPFNIVAADFDGDGDVDLATPNQNPDEVAVLLNDGAAQFTMESVPLEATPFDIAAGDLDGDGDVDLATANESSGTVSILLNDGAGGFAVAATLAAGFSPAAITTADLDGDLDPDLAVANVRSGEGADSGDVTVLRNDGSGGFGPPAAFPVGAFPINIVAADLDGDGDADLATANNVKVSTLENDGTGSFGPATVFGGTVTTFVSDVAAGDLDGDGDVDLVAGKLSSGPASVRSVELVILRNDDGRFGSSEAIPLPADSIPENIMVADLDGDGDLDLVCEGTPTFDPDTGVGGTTVVFLNGGNGIFNTTRSFPTTPTGRGVALLKLAADLDGDVDIDLVFLTFGDELLLLRNDGAGNFGSAKTIPVLPSPFFDGELRDVTAADLDGDGDLDLATASFGGEAADETLTPSAVSVFPNDGAGGFSTPVTLHTTGDNFAIAAADVNADGAPDLVASDVFTPSGERRKARLGGSLFLNRSAGGAPTFTTRRFDLRDSGDPFRDPPLVSFIVVDANADGNLDLVSTNLRTVSVQLGNGAGRFRPSRRAVTFPAGENPNNPVGADLDGDGDVDLAVANQRGRPGRGASSLISPGVSILFNTTTP